MPLSEPLTLKIEVDDEIYNLKLTRLRKAMDRLGAVVVEEAQQELDKQGKVVSGELRDSLYYVVDTGKDSMTLEFAAGAAYWDFVNQGVQGAGPYGPPKNPSGKGTLPYENRAPKSPYKFGSGQGGPGSIRGGIDRWVVRKPVGPIRDAKGRFIPRKRLVSMITSSVWKYGIAPSNYYTLAIDKGYKQTKARLAVAVGQDVNQYIEENLAGTYTINIEL